MRFGPRQIQVIQGLFMAMSCNEIAAHLRMKPKTVKGHIQNIARKLGCWNDPRFVTRVRIVWLLRESRLGAAYDA